MPPAATRSPPRAGRAACQVVTMPRKNPATFLSCCAAIAMATPIRTPRTGGMTRDHGHSRGRPSTRNGGMMGVSQQEALSARRSTPLRHVHVKDEDEIERFWGTQIGAPPSRSSTPHRPRCPIFNFRPSPSLARRLAARRRRVVVESVTGRRMCRFTTELKSFLYLSFEGMCRRAAPRL